MASKSRHTGCVKNMGPIRIEMIDFKKLNGITFLKLSGFILYDNIHDTSLGYKFWRDEVHTIFRSRMTQNVVDNATTLLRYHCVFYVGKQHCESSATLRD